MINRRTFLMVPAAGAIAVTTTEVAMAKELPPLYATPEKPNRNGLRWLDSFLPHQREAIVSKERISKWDDGFLGATWTATAKAIYRALRGEDTIYIAHSDYAAFHAWQFITHHHCSWFAGACAWREAPKIFHVMDRTADGQGQKVRGTVRVQTANAPIAGINANIIIDKLSGVANQSTLMREVESAVGDRKLTIVS